MTQYPDSGSPPCASEDQFHRTESDWLEIIFIVGARRLEVLGVIPGHARQGLSDGVVSSCVGDRRGGRANRSSAAPSGLHAVERELTRVILARAAGYTQLEGE